MSTKSYSLRTEKSTFNLYVSEPTPGLFAASILHWKLTKDRLLKAPGDLGFMEFCLETRVASTEQAALEEVLNWARQEFTNVGQPTPRVLG